jgi:GNAT superfamily N-acetyltransferase
MIRFAAMTVERKGLLAELLHASYAPLIADASGYWYGLTGEFTHFDDEVFDNPDTVGGCTFLTEWDKVIVGFASFDPGWCPDHGVVGHNCVLPSYQRQGIGRRQIREILSRLEGMGARKVVVSTSEHPFFLPARRTYASCGFTESRRFIGGVDPRYSVVELVRDLTPTR